MFLILANRYYKLKTWLNIVFDKQEIIVYTHLLKLNNDSKKILFNF